VEQEVSVRNEFVTAMGAADGGVEFDTPLAEAERQNQIVQRRTGVNSEMVLAARAISPFGDVHHP